MDYAMLLEGLRTSIANNDVVLVLGSGVTIASTGGAEGTDWRGLIESGLDRIAGLKIKSEEWKKRAIDLLNDGDLEDLLGVAQQVQSRLRQARELAPWMEEVIGNLNIVDNSLYSAIANIRAPLTTTNYDLIGETALVRRATSWNRNLDVGAWLRIEENIRPIFHLHGIYSDVDSIVLGQSSYQYLRSNIYAQFVQRLLVATKSLLFIGCGSGLDDPNMGALIRWISQEYAADSGPRHYRLCTKKEANTIKAHRRLEDRVFLIEYGDDHEQLASFISKSLSHPSRVIPPEVVGLATAYDGLTDAAYPNKERWERKDMLFEQMRDGGRIEEVHIIHLLNLKTPGCTIAAIAGMIRQPQIHHIPLVEKAVRLKPPINIAFKILDFVKIFCESGVERPEGLINILKALKQMEYTGDVQFPTYFESVEKILNIRLGKV